MVDFYLYIVVKWKNFMFFFREDDWVDVEFWGFLYDLKDVLIKKDDSVDVKVV